MTKKGKLRPRAKKLAEKSKKHSPLPSSKTDKEIDVEISKGETSKGQKTPEIQNYPETECEREQPEVIEPHCSPGNMASHENRTRSSSMEQEADRRERQEEVSSKQIFRFRRIFLFYRFWHRHSNNRLMKGKTSMIKRTHRRAPPARISLVEISPARLNAGKAGLEI